MRPVARYSRELSVPLRLGEGGLVLFIVDIRDSIEKEQREDVGLEIGGIDGAAQNAGRLPEVGF